MNFVSSESYEVGIVDSWFLSQKHSMQMIFVWTSEVWNGWQALNESGCDKKNIISDTEPERYRNGRKTECSVLIYSENIVCQYETLRCLLASLLLLYSYIRYAP